ncbi:F-box family protein, partial [Trifolium medium]|nr:F-box family protein [Trifolium medium]
ERAIIYSQRDMRVERIGISNKACWSSAMNYTLKAWFQLVGSKSAIPTQSTFSIHSKEDDSEIGDMVADSSEEVEGILLYLDELISESDYEDELSDSEFVFTK